MSDVVGAQGLQRVDEVFDVHVPYRELPECIVGGRPLRMPIWTTSGGKDLFPVLHGKLLKDSAELVATLRRVLPLRPGAFVDIGAHMGESLVALLLADATRRYVG